MAVAYKTFEDMATGTQRIIFQCKVKGCNCVWAYDYMVIPSGKYTRLLRHDTNKSRVWIENEHCPECGFSSMKSNEVVGTITNHVCDAKCRRAKGSVCDCSCGGLHHGESFLRKY